MVRRTKEEAQETRNRIIDAAERVFLERGVSRTSLNEIAAAAGVTRGAIYWHFQDKSDVFNAMMMRVTLPLEEAFRRIDDPLANPVLVLRDSFADAFARVVRDPQLRRVFEIAINKVEYVEETKAVRDRHISHRGEKLEQMERAMAIAATRGLVRGDVPASVAACGLHALISGLFQNWLLQPEAFDLNAVGLQAFDTFVAGLGFKPD
ncbi:TetR family transcriptional regulator [Piscinibacter gummiphilus]|uniref:TetR family transcriptional regulator n=1 Tax=Piscinibacter gummiphilus TaxID=946333 RepID=A0A1W6L2V3_9BURK|nr:TetR family transcriptional regulator [Piscinibacter gummiphilus]ARN18553.1 TetR family transcriptional regulator [Piscinibacter gummiphilus]ATU63181.1 TetR family transcriptional regulator [Piscinibacter gummiphilus]GLS95502.1 TetR family transcriptional regulator [Piscinibacter gummiphilus]